MKTKIEKKRIIAMGDDRGRCRVEFRRTLRVSKDGKSHKLPPNLGAFPLYSVDKYKDTVPKNWIKTGGLFFPMFQREAMFLRFTGGHWSERHRKFALKIGVGMINVISGKKWENTLNPKKADYVVIPGQEFLDGMKEGSKVKQFVAEPLGSGKTVEGETTGEEKFGGIQLLAYGQKIIQREPRVTYRMPLHNLPPPSKRKDGFGLKFGAGPPPKQPTRGFGGRGGGGGGGGGGGSRGGFAMKSSMSRAPPRAKPSMKMSVAPPKRMAKPMKKMKKKKKSVSRSSNVSDSGGGGGGSRMQESAEMGISKGGSVSQEIKYDAVGYEGWDQSQFARCYIRIVNSTMFKEITGEDVPKSMVTKEKYKMFGYKWDDSFEEK